MKWWTDIEWDKPLTRRELIWGRLLFACGLVGGVWIGFLIGVSTVALS